MQVILNCENLPKMVKLKLNFKTIKSLMNVNADNYLKNFNEMVSIRLKFIECCINLNKTKQLIILI